VPRQVLSGLLNGPIRSLRKGEREGLAEPSCRLESSLLIPGAVKNVENIGPSARAAIVDEVFSRRKAFHSCSDFLRRSPCLGMFAEQPEAVHYAIHQAIGGFWTCSPCPINVNLVEVLVRLFCVPVAHCCLGSAASPPPFAAGLRLLRGGQDAGATPWSPPAQ
jgi:hypothetical protein